MNSQNYCVNELSTRELFSQLQSKLIIDLKEKETLCPECKGLRFVLVEGNNKAYIESCRRCYTGKLEVCKHCGTANKSWCYCKEANEERSMNLRLEQVNKEFEAYQKAEKVHYKDYDGKFILNDGEHVKDIDDVAEWIYEKLQDGKDVPDYLWATKAQPVFSIDLYDVIYNECEDGYEEMYSHLSTKSPLLTQAQALIKQWEDEQGESLNTYYETYKKAVIIKDLVDEIRKELEDEK